MRTGLSKELIARVLGGEPKYTIAELEKKYPPRFPSMEFKPGGPTFQVGQEKMVTRFAPSPTGFMHTGHLYSMIIDFKLAQQSGGIFMLRVEDTDTARTVEGATDLVFETAKKFKISPNEGFGIGGDYGPYFQSERRDIYHSVVAELLSDGRAYPCFLTKDEMDKIREMQEKSGIPPGIYGEYARDRDLTESEIIARLDNGEVPSIRWYSTGDESRRIWFKDVARGSIFVPEWNKDEVLIKSSDRLPTYHFAMLCDDHFMRTTHIVRDESYFGTVALHVMLFNMMGWAMPAIYHTSTLDKIDEKTGNRRKLSKRYDPEASVANFLNDGWPVESVLNYILNILSSGYEEAMSKDSSVNFNTWPIKLKKMPTSGALFDMKKLEWWAREFIATLNVDELMRHVVDWAKEYSPEWAARLRGQNDYLHSILAIERDNPKRIRKDFVTWKQTLEEVSYFFDDLFRGTKQVIDKKVLTEFLKTFDIKDDKDVWWKKIVDIAARLGVSNGDAAMALRVALTNRSNTPDLYSIMQVMGDARVRKRIELCLK
ncbi:MAG: glutamate--tRNA ligase family protein [Alphaproteobacteria bacterium]|nr:glutamate--tRNA ligase family protein [Alphaproteobacteria bacterium]